MALFLAFQDEQPLPGDTFTRIESLRAADSPGKQNFKSSPLSSYRQHRFASGQTLAEL
jgi:hypothetical protein